MEAKFFAANPNDSTQQCAVKQSQSSQKCVRGKQKDSSESPFFSIGLREYFQYEMPVDKSQQPNPKKYKKKDRADKERNEKLFCCTDCDSGYKSRAYLVRHLNSQKHRDQVARNATFTMNLHMLPTNGFDERSRSSSEEIQPFQLTDETPRTYTYQQFPTNGFDECSRSLSTGKIQPFQQTKEFRHTYTYQGFQQLHQFNKQFTAYSS